ncbi:MAG: uroporphyrinogen decarboxylase family protein [Defluviitaleaceae bacterium]|nr:uroporphyrinogen decarboxylase family protein [Defluviitaleaceae bacterium]
MTSLERFYATINRQVVDRPALWLGLPDIKSHKGLFEYFNVNDMHELKTSIGDDFYAVEMPYNNDGADAIYAAFDWYGKGTVDSHERTLNSDGCFKDAEELEDLSFFNWPDPIKGIDPLECRRLVEAAPKDKAVLGILWSAHFQDACASFGMETALMNMLANPEIYEAVDRKIVDFYLKANEVFFEATKGLVHAVLIGNDIGSQMGLMLSPELVRRFVIPGCRRLVAQAHSYGIKVIYHSCGAISDIIPDLIDAGVDAIHPIQALATGMDAESLYNGFDGQVSFCGGVDTQDLLVNGTPEDIAREVRRLRKIFPTGLILSPSHEAILPDISPKNIKAFIDTAQEFNK